MAGKRLNQDEALQSMLGIYKPGPVRRDQEAKSAPDETKKTKEKLVQACVYITEKHRRALKMRIALGNGPEDRDISSIVRAALDGYLTDQLKDI